MPAFAGLSDAIEKWANAYNPCYNGPWSDALTLIPFAALTVMLYLVAREKLLAPQPHQPGMES